MQGFNLYQSRPIERLATQIKSGGFLEKLVGEESTYRYTNEQQGVDVTFKAHQEPVAGDYICYLNDNDVYHVDAKTFADRNILDGETFGFDVALAYFKQGKRLARKGWNGSNMFAYLVEPGEYPAKMDAIKGVFENDLVPYRAYYALYALNTAKGDVAAWTPSGSDSLATDWFVVDSSCKYQAECPEVKVKQSDVNPSKPSPDSEMEQEIVDKGLIYPRIEAAHIDELMTQVVYDVHVVPGTTTTVITAMLPMDHINFSLCTEIMACVDPRNFNAELGKKYGIEKAEKTARNKLWELEGYALAKTLTI